MRIFHIDSMKFFCYFAIDGIGGSDERRVR